MLYLLYLRTEIGFKGSTRTMNFTKIAKIKRIAKNRNFRKICSRAKNRKSRSCDQSWT